MGINIIVHVPTIFIRMNAAATIIFESGEARRLFKGGYCVKKGKEIVVHVPHELSQMVWHFLMHGGQLTCEVNGR